MTSIATHNVGKENTSSSSHRHAYTLLFRLSVIGLLLVFIYKSSGVSTLWNFSSQVSPDDDTESNNGPKSNNKLPPSLAGFATVGTNKVHSKNVVVDLSSSVYKLFSSSSPTAADGDIGQGNREKEIPSVDSTFHGFASDLIENHLGDHFAPGTFDLDLVITLSDAQRKKFDSDPSGATTFASLLPCKDEAAMPWNIDLRRATNIGFPSCLSSWKKSLSTVKFYISLAFSKLVHDEELERVYVSILNTIDESRKRSEIKVELAARQALHAFKFSTAKIISAHLHHTIMMIQTLADGFRPPGFSSQQQQQQQQNGKRSPLFLINEFVKAEIFNAVERNSNNRKKSQSEKSNSSRRKKFLTSSAIERWLSNRMSLSVSTILQEEPSLMEFNAQNPVEGKFWNLLRNDIGCSSLERSCENPEGCRYICNREYLLRGGGGGGGSVMQQSSLASSSSSFSSATASTTAEIRKGSCLSRVASHRSKTFALARSVTDAIFGLTGKNQRNPNNNNNNNNVNGNNNGDDYGDDENECVQLVSLGSNNEFDWEDSMTKLVKNSGAPFGGIATFDCTLSQGVKPSPTMKDLLKIDEKLFSFFPLCIGVADERVDSLSKRKKIEQLLGQSAASKFPLSRQLLKDEGGKVVSIAELDVLLKEIRTKQPMNIYSDYSQTRDEDHLNEAAKENLTSSSVGNGIYDNVFEKFSSKVSILKMDIESFEFVAVPRWLQAELTLIGKQLHFNSQRSGEKNGDHQQPVLIDFSALPGMVTVEQLQTEIHRRGHKNRKGSTFVGALWLQWLLLNYHALGFVSVANEKNHVDNCCFEAVFVNYRYYIVSETWYSATVS